MFLFLVKPVTMKPTNKITKVPMTLVINPWKGLLKASSIPVHFGEKVNQKIVKIPMTRLVIAARFVVRFAMMPSRNNPKMLIT